MLNSHLLFPELFLYVYLGFFLSPSFVLFTIYIPLVHRANKLYLHAPPLPRYQSSVNKKKVLFMFQFITKELNERMAFRRL